MDLHGSNKTLLTPRMKHVAYVGQRFCDPAAKGFALGWGPVALLSSRDAP